MEDGELFLLYKVINEEQDKRRRIRIKEELRKLKMNKLLI